MLEFIGDKALDFCVIKLLIQKYGHFANGDPVDGTKISVWEQINVASMYITGMISNIVAMIKITDFNL